MRYRLVRTVGTACTAVLLATLTACGSSPDAPAGTVTPKPRAASSATPAAAENGGGDVTPCPIVSGDDVSKIFKASLGPTTVDDGEHSARCTFILVSSVLGRGIDIVMSTYLNVPRPTFATAKATAVNGGAQSVSGVGSDAYFDPKSLNLQMWDSSVAYALQAKWNVGAATAPQVATAKASLIALAKKTLASR